MRECRDEWLCPGLLCHHCMGFVIMFLWCLSRRIGLGINRLGDCWRQIFAGHLESLSCRILAIAPIIRLCQYVNEGRLDSCLLFALITSVVAGANGILGTLFVYNN